MDPLPCLVCVHIPTSVLAVETYVVSTTEASSHPLEFTSSLWWKITSCTWNTESFFVKIKQSKLCSNCRRKYFKSVLLCIGKKAFAGTTNLAIFIYVLVSILFSTLHKFQKILQRLQFDNPTYWIKYFKLVRLYSGTFMRNMNLSCLCCKSAHTHLL